MLSLQTDNHFIFNSFSTAVSLVRHDPEAAVMGLPADYHSRSNDLFWNFDLEEKEHSITMEWLNPVEGADLWVSDIVTYISE
ncbi:MAG: hypothetical protein MJY56_03325 [Bacteroidales bacterium]|nr:hypothetical protein [Bacteroidales bacterium]